MILDQDQDHRSIFTPFWGLFFDISYKTFLTNGMSSNGYLGRFFETARTAW
jgi:hypothetical protein